MKTLLVVFCLLALPFLLQIQSKPVFAEKLREDNLSISPIEAKKLDGRAKILSEYLASHDSPLQYQAQDFIDAATTYQLDWRLLPAIAGVESTFGKQIPGGFNAWGWGVYGSQAIYFNSWREGIFTIAKGLREGYLDKGLTDPYAINRVYASSPVWGSKVAYFMQDMENFANNFVDQIPLVPSLDKIPSIAAVSGQLTLRF